MYLCDCRCGEVWRLDHGGTWVVNSTCFYDVSTCISVIVGVVKFGDSIMVVGGEDDRSWMAGLFALKEENDKEFWVEGQELSGVMSTFGCGVANISKDLFRDGSPL